MLQVGGVHEAVMAAAPGCAVPIVQFAAPVQPGVPVVVVLPVVVLPVVVLPVVPLPVVVVPVVPLPVVVVPVVPLPVVSAAGAEDVQVRDGLGTIQPWTSTAVALIVSDVPLLAMKPVWPTLEPTSSAMHCTGQVSAL